ncbi:hypothetical protein [Tenacibaculum haliotis]|uniref:hypothetical protein n=1 Tax=Tenacibaculum haliotis TaxID=1888914 RepID=UPI0021AF5312|nr:hypothetical protein [Tenacibaculum haliotis]MCT4698563.1 hypothetical protein [Tenacibaculum haliotis]
MQLLYQNPLICNTLNQLLFMPIKSYLAHPHEGKKEELQKALSFVSGCEIIPAENKNVLVLVTETKDDTEDKSLKETIETLDSLKLLALVSGFNTPKNK